MTDLSPPPPEIEYRAPSIWRNLSVVWLVPILALAVALGIAWQTYSERGTLIEIRFENAGGVTAGETTVRYRDVVIGSVEEVRFSPDLQSVVVAARVDAEVLPFLDEDASFWVVRPEISAQGVTGLSTVVSGVYIEGTWNSVAGTPQRSFEGRTEALFVRPGEEGRVLTLNVPAGIQLQGGAPVSYRGLDVGRLEQPALSDDGLSVTVDVFIEAPHDARITSATRFWDTSGFSINLGAEGLSLDVESLASLVTGGIEFDQVFDDGVPLAATVVDPGGADPQQAPVFTLYRNEELARASAFDVGPIGAVPLMVQFNRLVRGVTVGTRVIMEDELIGEVTETAIRTIETPTGPQRRMVAELAVDPASLGLSSTASPDEVYVFLADRVEDGMRARLSSAGLIQAETRIELAIDYDAAPAALDLTAQPYPMIPWVPAAPNSLNTTAEGVLERVAALPFEELLDQTIETLASIEGVAGNPDLRDIPAEAITLLSEARDLIGGEDTQAIPGAALDAVANLRAVLADISKSGVVEGLTSVLGQADTALGPIAEASEQLPAIMANIATLSETAAELEIAATIASADAVLAGIDAFLSAEGMDEVPENLAATLAELESLSSELRAADVVGSLNGTLAAANSAASDLQGLVERTGQVLTQASGLLASYGARSDFMGEAMSVLQEITNAAQAIGRLARTIERNPNSLLTGR